MIESFATLSPLSQFLFALVVVGALSAVIYFFYSFLGKMKYVTCSSCGHRELSKLSSSFCPQCGTKRTDGEQQKCAGSYTLVEAKKIRWGILLANVSYLLCLIFVLLFLIQAGLLLADGFFHKEIFLITIVLSLLSFFSTLFLPFAIGRILSCPHCAGMALWEGSSKWFQIKNFCPACGCDVLKIGRSLGKLTKMVGPH